MTEAELVRKQMRAMYRLAEKRGKRSDLLLLKVHGGPNQPKGIPDILGCYKGLYFAIEAKRPGHEKNLSPYQAAMLKKIEDAGGISAMCTTVPEALSVLRSVMKKAKRSRR